VDAEVRWQSQEVKLEMAADSEVERPTEAQVQYALWMVGAIEEWPSDVNLEDRAVLEFGMKCFKESRKEVSRTSHPDKGGNRDVFEAFYAAEETIKHALSSGLAPNGVREPTQVTLAGRPKCVGAAARAQRKDPKTSEKNPNDFD
jgi:hypothetical protein